MTAADFITGEGCTMGHLTTFEIWRPVMKPDPYNPNQQIAGEISKAGAIEGYLDSGTATTHEEANRDQTTSRATITIPNPDTDLARGDTLKANNRQWRITSYPANDINPFTGWQPTLLLTVEEITG